MNSDVQVGTLDGLHLAATLTTPEQPTRRAIILVHGSGVTREEGGFFTRLATGLADNGVASLRYDLRGHGQSDGQPQESSLAAHLNDIRVAFTYLQQAVDVAIPDLLGTSFGGGLAAYYAAKQPDALRRLVLLNPQLDYRDRYIHQKPHWSDDEYLREDKVRELAEVGYIDHSPTVQHSRAFLNEVFWINPSRVLDEITAPTLVVHGTKDTFASIDGSRAAMNVMRAPHQLVEIEGAQHGFAVPDDGEYKDPQTQAWQASVIRTVGDWLTGTTDG